MTGVPHDRIHARRPSHHVDRWSVGRIESVGEQDGHCVVTVRPDDGSPIGERVRYRKRGAVS